MAFESQHNMTVDASLTPRLWNALFRAQARGEQNQHGYTYAIASKQSPETLTIWHDGRVVERTLANTGIPVSPTVDGTFPVYERFRFTIMSGTNPDGSHYSDPVSFVSYFNGGDAVHYFPRGSYGFQQSLGCVELPYTAAQRAYPVPDVRQPGHCHELTDAPGRPRRQPARPETAARHRDEAVPGGCHAQEQAGQPVPLLVLVWSCLAAVRAARAPVALRECR